MKRCLILLLVFGLFSCSEEDDITQIRIINRTGLMIKTITVNTGGNINLEFSDVDNDQYSSFKPTDIAYKLATGEAIIEDTRFISWVHDYVGEKEIGDGKFTYEVYLNDLQDTTSMVIQLIE